MLKPYSTHWSVGKRKKPLRIWSHIACVLNKSSKFGRFLNMPSLVENALYPLFDNGAVDLRCSTVSPQPSDLSTFDSTLPHSADVPRPVLAPFRRFLA